MTTPEEAKAVVRRWNEEGWSGGKYEIAHEVIAPEMTVHGAGGQAIGMGPDALIDLIRTWRTAFPDGHMTIEELIVDGDLVGICNTWHGTHTAEFYGIPPSGKWVEVTSVGLDRVKDGQVVEGWGELDMVGMMQQMGALPMVGPGAVASGTSPLWGDDSKVTGEATTSPTDNKELLARLIEAQAADDAAAGDATIEHVLDAAFVDHNPAFGTSDRAGLETTAATLRAAFPDLKVTVNRDTIVAEGDRAVAHSIWTGTHTGDDLFGAAASGKTVTWTQSELVRVAGGRIVERWVSADTLTLFQQAGVLPSAGG